MLILTDFFGFNVTRESSGFLYFLIETMEILKYYFFFFCNDLYLTLRFIFRILMHSRAGYYFRCIINTNNQIGPVLRKRL